MAPRSHRGNAGWDRIVFDLVSAVGQNSDGSSLRQQDYGFGGMTADAMRPDAMDDDADNDDAPSTSALLNPAVNFPLKYLDAPQDFAGAASRTFLGVQIQCAQCHDHKTEKWKQTDFQSFAAAFSHSQVKALDKGNPRGKVRRIQLREIDRVPPRFKKNADSRRSSKPRRAPSTARTSAPATARAPPSPRG